MKLLLNFIVVVSKKRSNKTKLWHRRLGYISEGGLNVLYKQGLFVKNKISDLDFCQSCVCGEICRVKFNRLVHTTKEILDYVHVGLWGHQKFHHMVGKGIFLSIVDDFFRKL